LIKRASRGREHFASLYLIQSLKCVKFAWKEMKRKLPKHLNGTKLI
jgi:hypothetical protein